jgi:2-polyprenyl-6-methoxyphenol hydroxylase-like FAD-dependent oxidoreductase
VNLHGRGHEVVVIEIDPEPFTSVGVNPADVLTQRIWRLYRSARRHRIWELGIPLVQWDPSQPLDGAIAELNQLRQRSWRTLA